MKQRIFALHCTAADQFSAKIRNDIITFQTQQVHLKSFSTEIQNTILLFYLKTVIWNAKMFIKGVSNLGKNFSIAWHQKPTGAVERYVRKYTA